MDNLEEFNTVKYDDIDSEIPNDEYGISALSNRRLLTEKSDRSLSDLVRMINTETLKLSPSYQRDFVWKELQQSIFVESILLEYQYPLFLFLKT